MKVISIAALFTAPAAVSGAAYEIKTYGTAAVRCCTVLQHCARVARAERSYSTSSHFAPPLAPLRPLRPAWSRYALLGTTPPPFVPRRGTSSPPPPSTRIADKKSRARLAYRNAIYVHPHGVASARVCTHTRTRATHMFARALLFSHTLLLLLLLLLLLFPTGARDCLHRNRERGFASVR